MTDTQKTTDKPLSNIPSTPQDPKKAPKPKAKRVELKDLGKTKVGKANAKSWDAIPSVKKAGKTGPSGKSGIVMNMMLRPKGTTTAELLKATGWPAITAKGQGTAFAKKYGYRFSKSKAEGEPTRYFLKAKN